jgi:hypothetical protein
MQCKRLLLWLCTLLQSIYHGFEFFQVSTCAEKKGHACRHLHPWDRSSTSRRGRARRGTKMHDILDDIHVAVQSAAEPLNAANQRNMWGEGSSGLGQGTTDRSSTALASSWQRSALSLFSHLHAYHILANYACMHASSHQPDLHVCS